LSGHPRSSKDRSLRVQTMSRFVPSVLDQRALLRVRANAEKDDL
jgi:hypothetical protein